MKGSQIHDPEPIRDAIAALRAAQHDLSIMNMAAPRSALMVHVRSAETHISDAQRMLADVRGELGKPVLTVVEEE